MAMFPIFIVGLLAGALLTTAFFIHKKETPSEVRFRLQEATIIALKEDIASLETVNFDLRTQLTALQDKQPAKRGRKPKHAAEE